MLCRMLIGSSPRALVVQLCLKVQQAAPPHCTAGRCREEQSLVLALHHYGGGLPLLHQEVHERELEGRLANARRPCLR